MTDNQKQDRTEKYLHGELSPQERQAFEMEMEDNLELRSFVLEQRLELDAMDVLVARDLRARMAQWKQETPPTGGMRRFWWVIIPLALVGIVALLYFLPKEAAEEIPAPPKAEQTPAPVPAPAPQEAPSQPAAPASPAEAPQAKRETSVQSYMALALAYYEAPHPNGEWRSTEPPAASNVYAEALQALEKSRFEEVLALIPQMDPSQTESAVFLKGHALFGLKRYSEAAAEFRSLIDPPSLNYRDAADWNEVLCLLAVSQRPNRQNLEQRLQTIAGDGAHPYSQKALELKNALAASR